MAGKAGTRSSSTARSARPSGRAPAKPRTRAASTTRTATKPAARAPRTTRTVTTPQGPGPTARAAGAVAGGLARGIGAGVRAVGRTREIEPGHRRDGLALVLLALGVLVGAGVWVRAGGPVGSALDTAVRADRKSVV